MLGRFQGIQLNGETIGLTRALTDKVQAARCVECGSTDSTQRCDAVIRDPHRLTCDRRLCRHCAIHDPTKNDTDYCPEHAGEAGFLGALIRRG